MDCWVGRGWIYTKDDGVYQPGETHHGQYPSVGSSTHGFQATAILLRGIDSDGCAFDAMELKQKEWLHPSTIRVWGLQPISKYARETAEWVNCTPNGAGQPLARLVKVFELLRNVLR